MGKTCQQSPRDSSDSGSQTLTDEFRRAAAGSWLCSGGTLLHTQPPTLAGTPTRARRRLVATLALGVLVLAATALAAPAAAATPPDSSVAAQLNVPSIPRPILTVHVYDEAKFEETLELVDNTSPYALTGAVFAQDRYAIDLASERLQNAAG